MPADILEVEANVFSHAELVIGTYKGCLERDETCPPGVRAALLDQADKLKAQLAELKAVLDDQLVAMQTVHAEGWMPSIYHARVEQVNIPTLRRMLGRDPLACEHVWSTSFGQTVCNRCCARKEGATIRMPASVEILKGVERLAKEYARWDDVPAAKLYEVLGLG